MVYCGVEKANQMGCHSLVLCFQQCVEYLLAQLVRFPSAIQVVCFIGDLKTFGKLTTYLVPVLFYGRF